MLQCCIFGGYEGALGPERRCYLTLFGGCTLHRPTLARQMITARQSDRRRVHASRVIFFTMFGTTEIKCPTLAEEFIDLREAVASGTLDLNQWDSYVVELENWQSSSFMSFTLFASLAESALPSDNDEVESLALQRHLGNINGDGGRILEMGVGQSGAQRRAVILQAVQSA